MVGRQAEGHEGQRGHVERTVVGVPVGGLGLVAAETDGQVTAFVEVLLLVEHAVEHLCQGCTYLSIGEFLGQRLIPGHQGQRLHGGHTVRCGAAYDGEGALRRDEALKDDAELLGTFQFALAELLVVDAPSAGIGIDHVL